MIKVSKLSLKFDHRGIAGINDINLTIPRGEVFGVMGPNGSGKSTLLKILAKEITADSGEVITDDKIVFFKPHSEISSLNVLKFLTGSVTLDIDDEKKIQLARDLADTFEFTFQLRQNLSEVSSGQRQKILLAKELINRPSVILLDEPFTHLDPFMRVSILTDLFHYIKHQSMTVIWVTHDLDEALKFSDRLALMNFGKFEQVSPPLDFMKHPKNLFVAKFMGYRNFFPVKELEGKWQTPWGPKEKTENFAEGILVVPDAAWNLSQGEEAHYKSSVVSKQSQTHILDFSGKEIFVDLPAHKLISLNAVKLSPIWDSCFVIPL